jgi:hypothetical protein
VPHLRLPALAPGVTAFLWALFLSLYLFFGALAIGVARPTAFIVSVVAGFFIFLFVRLRGQDLPVDE